MKKRSSWGILGGFRGILGAIAFGFVFSFGLGNGLPSHVVFGVTPAAFQRNNVIDNEIRTFSCRFPSYRAGMIFSELMLCVIGTKDSPAGVPDTSLAPSTGERGNSKQ